MAFVPPRYAAQAVGGAEAVSREMALGLAGRGWEVEVLTTCAVDHYTWENVLPVGAEEDSGVVVRRFPTVRTPSHAGLRAEIRIGRHQPLSQDEQVTWLAWRMRSPELFHHLVAHGGDFDAVVFSPYLFWTTVAGLTAVPERAVTIPCLHDEPYARLDALLPAISDPAMVWFLSEPEHELAHRIAEVAPRHAVTGAGVHVPESYDPGGFRLRHGLDRPFLLYAGRREGGKGWNWLVDMYCQAASTTDVEVDLVTIGVGDASVPPTSAGRVVDLGYLDAHERDNALAAAVACVQPSLMESFSRTVMESWLAGSPVLARSGGEVVSWHVGRSGGGLVFADAPQLARAMERLVSSPDEGRAMAERGRTYVLDNYTWDSVLDRVEAELRSFT